MMTVFIRKKHFLRRRGTELTAENSCARTRCCGSFRVARSIGSRPEGSGGIVFSIVNSGWNSFCCSVQTVAIRLMFFLVSAFKRFGGRGQQRARHSGTVAGCARMVQRIPDSISGKRATTPWRETSISAGSWEAACASAMWRSRRRASIRVGEAGRLGAWRPAWESRGRDMYGGYCFPIMRQSRPSIARSMVAPGRDTRRRF